VTAPLRVLFLDIDGVLNSHRTALALGGVPHDLTPAGVAMLDPVALALVRNLCRAAGLSVVVSSSWRILHHWDAIGRALNLPTMGATPRSPTGFRGDEVAAWLAEHPEVKAWAVVDDDCDFHPAQASRFVRVDGEEGLSWVNFLELCSVFDVDPMDCTEAALSEAGL
jgi:hypothetical protein